MFQVSVCYEQQNSHEFSVRPPTSEQDRPLQATRNRRICCPRGPATGLHEHSGHGVQHVRPDDAAQVVRMGRCLLQLRQFRARSRPRRRKTDDQQFHVEH